MSSVILSALKAAVIWLVLLRAFALAHDDGLDQVVRPFFREYCISCHSSDDPAGNLKLDQGLLSDFRDPTAKAKWLEIVDVLNGHQMPPESESQPNPESVAQVVDWITSQLVRVDAERKGSLVLLRRLNRDEYRNTIRDLLGVELDVSRFPTEGSAAGFDNNGLALTTSPLHIELFIQLAKRALDLAIVEGERPQSILWRFEPESGHDDSNRVPYGPHWAIVNGGNNPVENGFKVMHHTNWDKHLNARDFAVPIEGDYIIRVRGGSKIPSRELVVSSAERFLAKRRDEQNRENPNAKRWHDEQYQKDLKHFRDDRMYDYGPARLKIVVELGGQPKIISTFDLDGTVEAPKVYEFKTRFSTQKAGITLEYEYSIPKVLENFWLQTSDDFARPVAYVDWFEIEGPYFDQWPPTSHRNLLRVDQSKTEMSDEKAREVLVNFMRRAYRRPVTRQEVDEKLALYSHSRQSGLSAMEAIKLPLATILCSPSFLYLFEPRSEDSPTSRKLNEHELAARLSYFLWGTMPDDELFRLASHGQLRRPDTLRAQIGRMLKHDRRRDMVTSFVGQWLGLRDVGANPPAEDLYPQYDRHLEWSMVRESLEFFDEILQKDLSALHLVRSDFVVINERLARFYGVPDVRGDHFRTVSVPDGVHRGGIPTQAAIHTITSNGTRTSPVKRGTWVLKNLLGMDPGLPVANAGDIAPKVPGIDKATVRKRLEIHRTLPQCARCHNKIDPLGFALENFNACGEWREQEGFGYKGRIEKDDPPIDNASKLPDGTPIVGIRGLQQALISQQDLFLQCLLKKLMTYALGRELGPIDQPMVQQGVDYMRKNNLTIRSAIEFIVLSDAFQSK